MTKISMLAAALLAAAPLSAASAQAAHIVDFASLSARYSVYPSTDTAADQIGKLLPPGLPATTARERLTALGMSCGATRHDAFRCHYATSVTIDALYIVPIVWLVTVQSQQGMVRTTMASVG